MDTKRATVQELHALHGLLAQYFQRILENALEPSLEALPPTAADIGLIVKFLKDNEITADPGSEGELENLRSRLREVQERGSPALKRILENAESDLRH